MRPLIALAHLIIVCLLTHSAYAKDRLVVLNVKVNRDRNQLVVKPFEAKALTNELREVALEYGGNRSGDSLLTVYSAPSHTVAYEYF